MRGGRAVLGMVGCLVLADEMVHVLENDPEVENILLLDSEEGRVFMDKLDPAVTGQYVRLVTGKELEEMELTGPSVVVRVNTASLHDDPASMLENLASSIHALSEFCGSILLFYGQCRNTKYELQRFVERFDLPVTFLTDADGSVVDDCFAAILGGRKRYMDTIRSNKCTMLLTTGYAEYWANKQEAKGIEEMVQQFEELQALFRAFGYKKVMVLDDGLGDREELEERAAVFASMFDMSIETMRCDTTVFERSYQLAWSKVLMTSSPRGLGEEVVLSRTLP